ncbi:hypothetical protein J6590_035461 [Homalodisca vitripennis]|nr:hypothetical protein J6590_035461 [Homalodisca vitripennis]
MATKPTKSFEYGQCTESVLTMDFSKIGALFYAFAGIPVFYESSHKLSKVQMAYTSLTFVQLIRAFAIELSYIVVIDGPTTSAALNSLYCINVIDHIIGVSGTTAVFVWNHRKLKELREHTSALEQRLMAHGRRVESKWIFCCKAMILTVCLSGIMNSCVQWIVIMRNIDEITYSVIEIMLLPIDCVMSLSLFALFWGVYYNFTISCIFETEWLGEITNQVVDSMQRNEGYFIFPFPIFVLPQNHQGYTGGLKGLFKTYYEIKSVRLSTNRLYWPHLAWMITGLSLYAATIFVSPFYRKPISHWVFLVTAKIKVLVLIFWLVLPVVNSVCNERRKSNLAAKLDRRIFRSAVAAEKRALTKMSLAVIDKYESSPWCLFDLDYTLLATVLDVAVLVATTFLVV